MKTAMQLAVEIYKNDGVSFTDWFIDNYEMLLEKEKEQIIDAYRISSINNSSSDDIQNIRPEYWQVNAEMWYDKHYNQNK